MVVKTEDLDNQVSCPPPPPASPPSPHFLRISVFVSLCFTSHSWYPGCALQEVVNRAQESNVCASCRRRVRPNDVFTIFQQRCAMRSRFCRWWRNAKLMAVLGKQCYGAVVVPVVLLLYVVCIDHSPQFQEQYLSCCSSLSSQAAAAASRSPAAGSGSKAKLPVVCMTPQAEGRLFVLLFETSSSVGLLLFQSVR